MRIVVLLRAAHAHVAHFAVAVVEDCLVFGVGRGGFLAVAAGEARVDFVVQCAADSFADALCLESDYLQGRWCLGWIATYV